MNPAELRMMWMSQYNPERIALEDAASFYGQSSVGLSVMDDIAHQSGTMDMNPMMSIVGGDYNGQTNNTGGTGGSTLGPTSHTLITTNPGDIYNIAHVGGMPQILHGPYTTFTEMVDDDDITDNDDMPQYITGQEYHHQHHQHGDGGASNNHHDQMDDSNNCYDPNTGLMHDNKEIINIDDFVMMDTNDSSSYGDSPQHLTNNDEKNVFILANQPKLSPSPSSSLSMSLSLSTTGSNNGGGGGGNAARKTRKIEPVNRPGLVLKTPIAYKGNIDPSVIPIERDGMAVCERCGAIGVKHTFYTKSRRFCSMACARGELFTLVCNNDQQNNKNQLTSSSVSNNSGLVSSAGGGASLNHHSNFNSSIINQFANIHNNNNNNNSNSNSNSNDDSEQQQQQQRTDLELELRVAHIRNNTSYRFKMSNENDDYADEEHYNGNSLLNGNGELNGTTNNTKNNILYRDIIPQDELPQIPKFDRLPSPCPQDDKIFSIRRKTYDQLNSFDWVIELAKPDFFAAPVTCFSHAPGYEMWDNIGIDMKVEVENTDCDNHTNISPGQTPHSFWVATVLNICGYKALMRYEGFDDESHDFWVNLCSSEVHPVGWCATRGKPLIPPKSIENKYSDWKDFLVTRLSGARTLPSNFYNKISDSFKSRFRCGLNLECVDKMRISQVKLGTVHKIVGKRLYVKYFDSPDEGFWCHEDAPIIHPVGWATTVGHNLAAPQEYLDRMLAGREQMIEVHEDDATIELFKMNFTFEEYYLEGKMNGFMEGMKLEAVDPLNLSSVCVATVMAVLKFGYMMIRIDSYDPDATGADWFCYHEKSPSIFPVGYCSSNNIILTPPNGYDLTSFTWETYLADTNSLPAHEHLFQRLIPDHGFQVGMKLECADLMDPKLVCVATVARIVGRLLKIRFDGWPEEYDQWLDCESPDFYPVGWCVLVNHKLEGPPTAQKAQPTVRSTPKTVRKKKKKKVLKTENSSPGVRPVGRPSINSIKREAQVQQLQQHNTINRHNTTPPTNTTLHLSGNVVGMNRVGIKMEMKCEPNDDDDDFDDDFDDDENTSLVSRSDRSTPLPNTPEPTSTQSLHFAGGDRSTKLIISNNSSNINSSNIVQKSSNTPIAQQAEKKSTVPLSASVNSTKYIPRLTDINNSPDPSHINNLIGNFNRNSELLPNTWNINDVAQFLCVNDCTSHCDIFSRSKIDGKRLLELSKDEIITILGMKVGPALKIFDLIQQLKCKLNPSKSRLLKANINKKYL